MVALLFVACATSSDPLRYRLADSGGRWDGTPNDPVLDDLRDRYAGYFAVILDPASVEEPDLRPLRDDLERQPVDRRNYDALNAIAIGYFEMNARAQWRLDGMRAGDTFFADSFRTAKIVAVPWRAYGEILEPKLRDAILDFFDDIASGQKPASGSTSGRLVRIVVSLERRESDPERLRRIREISRRLRETPAGQDPSSHP
jgi:hypothetical protein